MFRHEGPARTTRSNSILAGYLAFVAGFVNAAGLLLVGAFTSHVTGSIGRLSISLTRGDPAAATDAGLLVIVFLFGAVTASLLVEANVVRRTSSAYGVALLAQALVLAAFVHDGAVGLLSFSMGMQNSLVTRLSGSVVRTTHLTGVVTDLGIELARWLRWSWKALRRGDQPATGRNPATRPAPARSVMLVTIVVTFAVGGVSGTLAALAWGRRSIGLPAAAILAAAIYAFAAETGGPPDRPRDP
jgi:uncharacterized membrane protein YoaK (UPF0700 family)